MVFSERGAEPILGVVSLEEFLLAADPVNPRLVSVAGLLKQGGRTGLHVDGRSNGPKASGSVGRVRMAS